MGQSIATPLGDLKSWEDKHPYLAIRSAKAVSGFVPPYGQGSYNELFTVPGVFPGGPTVDQLGTVVNGQYQVSNLAGVAVESIRFLTFYNPSAYFRTSDVAATDFPGRAVLDLVSDPTPSRFKTNHMTQAATFRYPITDVSGDTFTSSSVVDGSTSNTDLDGALINFRSNGDEPTTPLSVERVYQIATTPSATTFTVKPWPEIINDTTTAAVTVTVPISAAVQIDVVAAAKTFTRASGDFTDDGFVAGQTILTSGYVTSSGTNNQTKIIASVTPLVITVTDATGLVDETGNGDEIIRQQLQLMVYRAELGTVIRQRTQTEHTAAMGAPGDLSDGKLVVSVHPPFLPRPEKGETITYPIKLGDNVGFYGGLAYAHSKAGPMLLRTRFGGLVDSGTTAVYKTAKVRTLMQGSTATVRPPVRITSPSLPIREGNMLSFRKTSIVGVADGSTKITTAVVPPQQVGDTVTFTGSGAGLTDGTRYWIGKTVADGIYVSSTKALALAGTFLSPGAVSMLVDTILPEGVDFGVVYYCSAKASAEEPAVGRTIGFKTDSGATDFTSSFFDHEMGHDEKVVVWGGTMPPELTLGRTYYVRHVAGQTRKLQLSESRGGAVITYTHSASINVILERIEDPTSFYISKRPGGELLTCDTDGQDAFSVDIQRRESFAGTFTGLQARCVSGANVGATVMLTHVGWQSWNSISTDIQSQSFVFQKTEWPNTPLPGDEIVIEPPPVDGKPVPFRKWAKFLPWSPLEGRGQGAGTTKVGTMASSAVSANSNGDYGVGATTNAQLGEVIKFYSPGEWLPNKLVQGRTYYVTAAAGGTVFFSETYDGPAYQPPSLAVASKSSNQLSFATAHGLNPNEPVKFIGAASSNMPSQLFAQGTFYVKWVDADTIELLDFPDGTVVALTDPTGTLDMDLYWPGSSSTVYTDRCLHEGKRNPHPPGFSYPNQHSLPEKYQPHSGPALGHSNGVSAVATIAVNMQHHFGEPIYVVNCAFGGTSLGHKELVPGYYFQGSAVGVPDIPGFGWSDPKQQLSWDPADQNGCFARLLDVLDAIVIADKEESVQSVIELAWMNQGEEDQSHEKLANRYNINIRKFKDAVRKAIFDRGLIDHAPEKLVFVHAVPRRDFGTYAALVEAAVKEVHGSDLYARVPPSASSDFDSKNAANPYDTDTVHLPGSSLDAMGEEVFDEWLDARHTGTAEIEICNAAMAHIGEKAGITSIDPPDDTVQAKICAQFYPLAIATMLEEHLWDFAKKRVTLVQRATNDRTDWNYAYDYPENVAGTPFILPAGATDDMIGNGGVKIGVPFDTSIDGNGKRVLLCNIDAAEAVVNAHTTDTRKFSALFKRAASYELASLAAGPIIKGDKGSQKAMQLSQAARFWGGLAKSHDSEQRRDRHDIQGEYIPANLRDR